MPRNKSILILIGILVLLVPLAGAPVSAQEADPTVYGKIVFSSNRDGNFEIYVMNADGSGQNNLTNNPGDDQSPVWSPDGSRIAFMSNRDGDFGIYDYEIYVMNADGSGQIRLTNTAVNDLYPAWSPNGSQIAFASNRDGNYEIYVMNADGSGQTRLTNNTAVDYIPAWSPDGSKIAFASNRDGNYEIYVMNTDGSGQTNLTNNPASSIEFYPAWSPDGSKIAFASNRDGDDEIYVMNADGSDPTNLTNNPAQDRQPAWSQDGSQILFSSSRNYNFEIYVMNADGSDPARLTVNLAGDGSPDWQPLPAGCYIDAPQHVTVNNYFTATVTCIEMSGVYGFQYDLNVDPSSPTLVPQASAFTPGSIFDNLSTLILNNDVTDGYVVTLQSEDVAVSGNVTLGSVVFRADDLGTATLTLDDLILGNVHGQEILDSLAADPNATITILALPLASFEGMVKREAGAVLTADIVVLADGVAPEMTQIVGDYMFFVYPEGTVALHAALEISAPGHLGCVTPDLGLPPEAHTELSPITLLAGDVNPDGIINLTDSSIIAEAWNGGEFELPIMPDLDEDVRITVLDLIHVGRNYGAATPACQ